MAPWSASRTNLMPGDRAQGPAALQMRAIGKAAHTSRPQEGNNAIYQMVECITRLRAEIERSCRRRRTRMAGPPVMTVSVIHGGRW